MLKRHTLASGGNAVTDVGGAPGNGNALTFELEVTTKGPYALTVRYSNPERAPATHYNPDPLARPADISVNGGAKQRVLFPHSFHANNFWELSVPVRLDAGKNTIRFSSGGAAGLGRQELHLAAVSRRAAARDVRTGDRQGRDHAIPCPRRSEVWAVRGRRLGQE